MHCSVHYWQVCWQVSASLLAALMPEGRGELSSRQLEGDTPVQWEQVTSHRYRLAGYLVQGGAVHRDFSQVSAPHLALYSLPHLGAGAAARMLAGFPCQAADLAVADRKAEWQQLLETERQVGQLDWSRVPDPTTAEF